MHQVLVIWLLVTTIAAVDINTELEGKLEEIVEQFESDCSRGCGWKYDLTISIDEQFPPILVWCPISRLKTVLSCTLHQCMLIPSFWMNRSKAGRQPRLIYGLHHNVILVARYYYCSGGTTKTNHRILSTETSIQDQTNDQLPPPFNLRHRTGWMNQLFHFIVTQLEHGNNFNDIHQIIEKLRFHQTSSTAINTQVSSYDELGTHVHDENTRHSAQFRRTPSVDHLQTVFLDEFQSRRSFYEALMENVKATSISMDHTFKISKNIGLARSEDNRWITQFQCLFIVLNEQGLVMCWKLTEKEGFNEVEPTLISLRERLVNLGSPLTHCVIDNCCKWSNNLKNVFGPGLLVKLDVFHAIQRLTKTIPKFNPLAQSSMKDLQMLVRQPYDSAQHREHPTAPPNTIQQNVNFFTSKWSKVNNSPVTAETMHQFQNLKVHIERGCLSHLPPGDGTNRNEKLHSMLNRSMLSGAARLGPELAYAVLTILFFQYNLRQKGYSSIPSTFRVKVMSSSNHHLQKHFPSAKPKDVSPELVCANATAEEYSDYISTIISHSDKLYNAVKSISSHSMSFDPTLLYYPSSFLAPLMPNITGYSGSLEETVHSEHLARNVAKYGRKILPIPKDGNCAFVSIASALTTLNVDDLSQLFKENPNISNDTCLDLELIRTRKIKEFSFQLRQAFVKHAYTKIDVFLQLTTWSKAEYLKELSCFENEGIFSGQIGDLVMSVLADYLQVPIILLTSIEGLPTIPLIPSTLTLSQPLYLAFNQFGPGHYDGTELIEKSKMLKNTTALISGSQDHSNALSCRCGTNEPNNACKQMACISKHHRKTRCPCFKSGLKCSSACKCKNCGNVSHFKQEDAINYNSETHGIDEMPPKPKRNRHSGYTKKASETFLSSNELSSIAGPYTQHEHCVIQSILCYIRSNKLRRDELSCGAYVHELYNRISSSRQISTVRPKSLRSIEAVLRDMKNKRALPGTFL